MPLNFGSGAAGRWKLPVMVLAASALAGTAHAQQAPQRHVPVSTSPEWVEVATRGDTKLFVDTSSVEIRDGMIHVVGRILLAAPDEGGAIEYLLKTEISCEHSDYAVRALDAFDAAGGLVSSEVSTEAPFPLELGSPNQLLHLEFCG